MTPDAFAAWCKTFDPNWVALHPDAMEHMRAAWDAATERAAKVVQEWPREFPSVEHTMLVRILNRIRGGQP